MEREELVSSLHSVLDRSNNAPGRQKHYEWLLFMGGNWLRIDHDDIIETHYCQPGAKAITINTGNGQVYIDFDEMETLSVDIKVQRQSFLPQGQTEDFGWYFRDDQLWKEYGSQGSNMSVSSVSSRDIERHFSQNRQGAFNFTVGSTRYTLDFPTMTQTNHTTGMCRNVRRRPKLTTYTRSPASTSASASASASAMLSMPSVPSVPNLSGGGYKWEFMEHEGKWTEYQAYICGFDSDAIEAMYQQNPQSQQQFRINHFSYTLDFSSMCQVNHNTKKRRAVRRTAADGSQQSSSVSSTARWQFQDVDGTWKEYSRSAGHCSVSSQDIELQYQQNPAGVMKFSTSRFKYELDFSAMTQKNLKTNTTRSVRRLNQ